MYLLLAFSFATKGIDRSRSIDSLANPSDKHACRRISEHKQAVGSQAGAWDIRKHQHPCSLPKKMGQSALGAFPTNQ